MIKFAMLYSGAIFGDPNDSHANNVLKQNNLGEIGALIDKNSQN